VQVLRAAACAHCCSCCTPAVSPLSCAALRVRPTHPARPTASPGCPWRPCTSCCPRWRTPLCQCLRTPDSQGPGGPAAAGEAAVGRGWPGQGRVMMVTVCTGWCALPWPPVLGACAWGLTIVRRGAAWASQSRANGPTISTTMPLSLVESA